MTKNRTEKQMGKVVKKAVAKSKRKDGAGESSGGKKKSRSK